MAQEWSSPTAKKTKMTWVGDGWQKESNTGEPAQKKQKMQRAHGRHPKYLNNKEKATAIVPKTFCRKRGCLADSPEEDAPSYTPWKKQKQPNPLRIQEQLQLLAS
eukprot:Lithocolla_globosa_v1_NODE_1393_length_2612_cov_3.151349.p6 type:complete len:105 gc:universal NODE_1393_length_2612_cov_3.151349:402-88(-)